MSKLAGVAFVLLAVSLAVNLWTARILAETPTLPPQFTIQHTPMPAWTLVSTKWEDTGPNCDDTKDDPLIECQDYIFKSDVGGNLYVEVVEFQYSSK